MGTPTGDSRRIAVDAMGGDLGPAEVVAAVRLALDEFPGLNPVTLVGDQAQLQPLVDQAGLGGLETVQILHASEVVTMDDKPLAALRRKKDSSMLRAIELVKDGRAAAAVSCGNTGCLVAAGIVKLRTLAGIDRAALAPVIPRAHGHFILIDAGANPAAEAGHLVHNAILGTHYCRLELGIARPRVGLLTIGTEEGKGNTLVAETHEQLKQLGDLINYRGPVEGFQVFTDEIDVLVCDGFVGNICLKSWESLAKFFKTEMKTFLTANPLRQLGAALSQGAFRQLKGRIEPERYGGAPLLGLRGNLIKAHGSANRQALKNALHDASEMIKTDLNALIEADVARARELLCAAPAAG